MAKVGVRLNMMEKIVPSENVYMKNSAVSGAGRGVFARVDIKKGELIESCPVIEISPDDMAALGESILVEYFFFHGKTKEKLLLALGFGSLYNHSYIPNATYTIHESSATIDFIAKTAIAKDSEITFDYKSGNSHHTDPLWFEV